MAQQLSNCGDQTQSECGTSMKQTRNKVTLTGQALGAYCECVAGKDSFATIWLPHFSPLHTTRLKESTLCQQTKLVHTTNVYMWKGHAAKKTAPAALDDIQIVKYASRQDKFPRTTLQGHNFDPRSLDARKRDEEIFNNRYQPLKAAYGYILN
ncbi:hypothetical protein V1264_022896 [Littorina saxatilis]